MTSTVIKKSLLRTLSAFTGRSLLATALLVLIFHHPTSAQLSCLAFGTATEVGGSITNSDPLQSGRIARDGRTSGCPGKPNTLFNSVPVRHRVHSFSNPTGQRSCVTIDIDFAGCGSNSTGIAAYSSFNAATPAANLLGDLGYGSIGTGRFSFSVEAGASFDIVVFEITPNAGCSAYSFDLSYSTNCRQPGFDWNNDRRCDLAMFTPTSGLWRYTDNLSPDFQSINWGIAGDVPQPGDFSGDGKTDVAIQRPSDGSWWWYSLADGAFGAATWGTSSDLPVAADYDGDGKNDIAVFRPSTGVWYVLRSSEVTFFAVQWGSPGDVPVPGDYDGDRRGDFAVFRPVEPSAPGQAIWWRLLSNFDYSFYEVDAWGIPTDLPVQADYDGDGKTDLATYRPADGIWFYESSILPEVPGGNRLRAHYFGLATDIPQPGDYDGDGIVDPAVYRESNATWYILGSQIGFRVQPFGISGETPVSAPYGIGVQ